MANSSNFHAGTTQINSRAGQPYKGTAVFPALDEGEAQNLRDVVGKLRKARPLGLARFALLRRDQAEGIRAWAPQHILNDDTLIYASPVLPMWGAEAEQNYYISRYLWSLRAMPAADELLGVWMLYAPHGALATALNSAARNASLLDTVRSALGTQDFSRALANATKPLHDIVVEADGTVHSLNRSGRGFGAKHPIHRLEGRGRKGEILLPMDEQFPRAAQLGTPNLPEYFQG